MTPPTESFKRVFYDLRPAKQVERRMIIDALQSLAASGFNMRAYQYVGMGSIYFVDFILLHRLLGMRKLLSIESVASAERRVRFNQPFRDVHVEIGLIGDYLPKIDRDIPHLVWLDYDHKLSTEDIQDVTLASSVLPAGSVLLVTVEVEPPESGDSPQEWRTYYEDVAGSLVPFETTLEPFAKSELPRTNARILVNAIRRGLTARSSIRFEQLFSFLYADGRQMLTLGGMLASEEDQRRLTASALDASPFIVRDPEAEPFAISVPRLTRKERLYLDQFMPCDDRWEPPAFTIDAELVRQYRDIYRYYPIYGELLM
jgi:hypothetical protein